MSETVPAVSEPAVEASVPPAVEPDEIQSKESGDEVHTTDAASQGLSKRALKKAAKRERTANMWKEKRQAAKIKKRERAAERKAEAATGPLSPETAAQAAAEQG